MGRNRKTSNIIKRITALLLAVLMAGSTLSDYVTVYAGSAGQNDVASGKTQLADDSGGAASDYARIGPYVAVTPVYGESTVTTSDVNTLANGEVEKGEELEDIITNSYRVEELVGAEEALLSLPSQNAATLMFVSKSIWGRSYYLKSEGSGKVRVYARSDNNTDSTSDGSNIKAQSGSTYLNNIVWSENTKTGTSKISYGNTSAETYASDSEFEKAAATGVYRSALKKYFQSSASDSQYTYDFSALTSQTTMTTKEAKAFIDSIINSGGSSALTSAQKVWNYITKVDTSSGYAMYAGELIEDYKIYGYNADIGKETNLSWSNKKSALSKEGTEGLLIDANGDYINDAVMVFTAEGYNSHVNPDANYCNNVYNLGFLDLLLCGYAIAKDQGGSAAQYWKEAIVEYLTSGNNMDSGVRLSVQVGIIIHGKLSTTDSTYYSVLATCNDLVNKSYGLSNITSASTTASGTADKTDSDYYPSASTVSKSISKPYSGYYGNDGVTVGKDKSGYLQWYINTSRNKESDTTGKGKSDTNGKNGSKKVVDTKEYQTYYSRLKNATKSAGATQSSGYLWYSKSALCHVLNEIYEKGEAVNDVQPDTAYIELLRARNTAGYQEASNDGNGISKSYGGGYIIAHAFRSDNSTASYAIGARLEISSTKYNTTYNKEDYWAVPSWSKNSKYKEGTHYFTASDETEYALSAGEDLTVSLDIKKLYDKNGKQIKLSVSNPTATINDTVKLKLYAHATEDSSCFKDFLAQNADTSVAPDIKVEFTTIQTYYTAKGKQKNTTNSKKISSFSDSKTVAVFLCL